MGIYREREKERPPRPGRRLENVIIVMQIFPSTFRGTDIHSVYRAIVFVPRWAIIAFETSPPMRPLALLNFAENTRVQ